MSKPCLKHEELFTNVVALVKEYLLRREEKSTKVIEFNSPEELRKLVDFEVRDEGIDDDKLLGLCRSVLKYSVHTRHPHFFNQLFTGVDEVGLMATFLTSASNTSMYTFEMAPVFSLMENEVLTKLRELVGWKGGRGDGIFSPGGSISNLYGMMMARFSKFPQTRTEGMRGLPQLVIYCSEDAHYSIKKASIVLGIGTDNVVKITSDDRGRMITSELEKALAGCEAKGVCPLAVVATAASTVIGAFDPLEEIAALCEKYSVWMHVDGCFGSSILMSRKHKAKARGIERADSLVWNPHKSLGVPLQCSAFLTRHEGLMSKCNNTHASYLFQQDKLNYNVSLDTGDKSIQCGRLNDVFKLWLMWKHKGLRGFEMVIDQALEMAAYLAESIRKRDGFQLVVEEPDYANVCFWYFPPKMRDIYPLKRDPLDLAAVARLTKVAPQIKARMIEKGSVMMTYQPRKDLPNFFRMTFITPTTEKDLDWLLAEIETLGEDIECGTCNGANGTNGTNGIH